MKQSETKAKETDLGVAFVNLFTAIINHETRKPVLGSERNMETTRIAQLIFGHDYEKYISVLEKRATASQQEAQEALQAIRNPNIGEVLLRIESEMKISSDSINYHRINEVRDHHLFRAGQDFADRVLSGRINTNKDAEKFFAESHLSSIIAEYNDGNILFDNSRVRGAIVALLEIAYPSYQCKEASHRAIIFEKSQVKDEDLEILLMDPMGRIQTDFIFSGLNIPVAASKEEINKILYNLPRGVKNKRYVSVALGPALSRDAKNYKAESLVESLGIYVNDVYDDFFEKDQPNIISALAIAQKDYKQVKIDDYIQIARKVMMNYHGR